MAETFGHRLKKLREAAGWTQPALAELISQVRPEWRWHQSTIAKIENGTRSVKIDELVAFSEAMGLTVDQLVFPVEDMEIQTGDDLWDYLNAPHRLLAQRLDQPHLVRIREIEWQIQMTRDRLRALSGELAEAYGRLSPESRPYEPEDED